MVTIYNTLQNYCEPADVSILLKALLCLSSFLQSHRCDLRPFSNLFFFFFLANVRALTLLIDQMWLDRTMRENRPEEGPRMKKATHFVAYPGQSPECAS